MTAPDFPAIVAAARDRMDQAERDVARIRDDLAALPPSDYVYARSWADLTERVVRWGRDVLDRHTYDLDNAYCTGCRHDLLHGDCPEDFAVLRAWVPYLLDEEER